MFKRETSFDAENYKITVPAADGEATISVFDKVRVQIEVEKDRKTQRGKVGDCGATAPDSSGLPSSGATPARHPARNPAFRA